MRKNVLMILGGVILLTSIFLLPNLYAVDTSKNSKIKPPNEEIVLGPFIDNPRFNSVPFSHVKHSEYDCTKCHHKWDGQSKIKTCLNSECHSKYEVDEHVYNKFHSRCYKGCHMEIAKTDKSVDPPVSCKKCHIDPNGY